MIMRPLFEIDASIFNTSHATVFGKINLWILGFYLKEIKIQSQVFSLAPMSVNSF